MNQSLSFAVLTASLFVNLLVIFMIISNQSLTSIENIKAVTNRTLDQNNGIFEFDSYSYTKNLLDNTSNEVSLYFSHTGSRKIMEINDFDVFSSLVTQATNKMYLHDQWLPYGSSNAIISAGTYWNYSLQNEIINPDIWDPGETLTILLVIYNETGNNITGLYSVGIYNNVGWGFEMVISL